MWNFDSTRNQHILSLSPNKVLLILSFVVPDVEVFTIVYTLAFITALSQVFGFSRSSIKMFRVYVQNANASDDFDMI